MCCVMRGSWLAFRQDGTSKKRYASNPPLAPSKPLSPIAQRRVQQIEGINATISVSEGTNALSFLPCFSLSLSLSLACHVLLLSFMPLSIDLLFLLCVTSVVHGRHQQYHGQHQLSAASLPSNHMDTDINLQSINPPIDVSSTSLRTNEPRSLLMVRLPSFSAS